MYVYTGSHTQSRHVKLTLFNMPKGRDLLKYAQRDTEKRKERRKDAAKKRMNAIRERIQASRGTHVIEGIYNQGDAIGVLGCEETVDAIARELVEWESTLCKYIRGELESCPPVKIPAYAVVIVVECAKVSADGLPEKLVDSILYAVDCLETVLGMKPIDRKVFDWEKLMVALCKDSMSLGDMIGGIVNLLLCQMSREPIFTAECKGELMGIAINNYMEAISDEIMNRDAAISFSMIMRDLAFNIVTLEDGKPDYDDVRSIVSHLLSNDDITFVEGPLAALAHVCMSDCVLKDEFQDRVVLGEIFKCFFRLAEGAATKEDCDAGREIYKTVMDAVYELMLIPSIREDVLRVYGDLQVYSLFKTLLGLTPNCVYKLMTLESFNGHLTQDASEWVGELDNCLALGFSSPLVPHEMVLYACKLFILWYKVDSDMSFTTKDNEVFQFKPSPVQWETICSYIIEHYCRLEPELQECIMGGILNDVGLLDYLHHNQEMSIAMEAQFKVISAQCATEDVEML